ncbi:MAG: HIT family protein [Nitrososphaerales archaeon]
MGRCVFCRIVERKADAVIVYEDDDTVAFMDKEPFNLGHTLVVTKKHYRYITDMPEEAVCSLFKVVSRLARAVSSATGADGLNIGQSNGEVASQQVFHVHVHVIPRFKGDTEHGIFPPRKQLSLRELKESGRRIQEALGLARSRL